MKTTIYPVRDLAAATALSVELLGVPPAMTQPYYVHFEIDARKVGLDPNRHPHGTAGSVGYWYVDDVHARLKALVAAGATVQQQVLDLGRGRLVATVIDPDGNVVGRIQPGS